MSQPVRISPVWINKEALLLMHKESLDRFGGADGIRDIAMLESALARPGNKSHYEPETSIPEMAAAHCFGIAMNHPFVDGNKRAAFLAMTVFLMLNGFSLSVDPIQAELAILDLIAGQMKEEDFARWIAANSKPYPAT